MSEIVWDEDDELMEELKQMCRERGLNARTVLEMVRLELGRVGLERRDGVFQDLEVLLQESLDEATATRTNAVKAQDERGGAARCG